jgi:hypothetical protein
MAEAINTGRKCLDRPHNPLPDIFGGRETAGNLKKNM